MKKRGTRMGPHIVNSSNITYVGEWQDEEPNGIG